MAFRSPAQVLAFTALLAVMSFVVSDAALAQGVAAASGGAPNLAPISLRGNVRTLLAVDPANPTIIPTDATPTRVGEERELLKPGFRFYLMQKLPPRMWFSSVTEVTNRFESNVLFTPRSPRRDYVYRVLPNITLGYNILPQTSLYANYFLIKDVFARTGFLSVPTFMSLAGGLRHEMPMGTRSNLQLDFQVRELWQARNLRQADMLPGITLTRVFHPRLIGFFNSQLQLRSRNLYGTGTFREIDPFYTVGLLGRWRDWSLIVTNTIVNNFRNRQAIPPQRNFASIMDVEINRPISKKLPGVFAFFRSEPIWNWGSRGLPGLSGFDYRIFGGLRLSVNKPSYYAQMQKLRKQLEGVSKDPDAKRKITKRRRNRRIAQSVSETNQLPIEMAIDIAHDEQVKRAKSLDTGGGAEPGSAHSHSMIAQNLEQGGILTSPGGIQSAAEAIRSNLKASENFLLERAPSEVEEFSEAAPEDSRDALQLEQPVKMVLHVEQPEPDGRREIDNPVRMFLHAR